MRLSNFEIMSRSGACGEGGGGGLEFRQDDKMIMIEDEDRLKIVFYGFMIRG